MNVGWAQGSSVTYTFNGTGIAYIGEKGRPYGKVKVYIDGNYQTTIDAYVNADTTFTEYLYSIEGLSQGKHTIKLEKETDANGGREYMLVDAFAVSNPQPLPI